ncbi:MAG: PAS domain S-box protein [Gammaproteobacteria bacterium]|nr:PAS domain S-box protein [Gammaproteobacteria bacterium]
MNQTLHEANYYTKSILDSMTEALFVTSSEGFIEQVNPAAERLLGYGMEEMIGKSIAELFVEEEEEESDDLFFSVDSPLDQLIRTGKGNKIEQLMLHLSGEQIPVMISGEIAQPTEAERYIVVVVQDMRERKRMEEQAQYNAFQSGVAEMSITILHNIGNAVTGLYGSSTRIIKQGENIRRISQMLIESSKKMVAEIESLHQTESPLLKEGGMVGNVPTLLQRSGELLEKMVGGEIIPSAEAVEEGINHISEVIRIQKSSAAMSHTITSFRLNELMQNIMVMQQEIMEKHGVEVIMNLDEVAGKLYLPRNQLIQLLLNLLKNSREAIVDRYQRDKVKGRIEVVAEPRGTLEFSLCVIDNGCGIPEKSLSKLFVHGYTTKMEGSGFGLHSAANFVNKLGGGYDSRE